MPAMIPNPYCIPYRLWQPDTMAIPKLYWDAYSIEQRWHAMARELAKIIGYDDYQTSKIDLNRKDIDYLLEQFEKFIESGFDDYYKAQIEQWVNDNLATIYSLLIKQVYFGLTLDGHFVAYIPESWDDIIFDTGFDYSDQRTFGRLILSWDVDNAHDVDQS